MQDKSIEPHAKRLYFKTYLQLLENSVGSAAFRNFYMQAPDGTEFDAMDNGDNSCAFFVSSVLTLFKKLSGIHGTIEATLRDARLSGWEPVAERDMQPGDLLVWEPATESDGHEHIGFYLGDYTAVSTSSSQRIVVRHDAHYGDMTRTIQQVLRYSNWD